MIIWSSVSSDSWTFETWNQTDHDNHVVLSYLTLEAWGWQAPNLNVIYQGNLRCLSLTGLAGCLWQLYLDSWSSTGTF